jgi:calmodulin
MPDSPREGDDALQELFTQFDADGDESVNEEEFRHILQTLGEDPSDAVLSLEFAIIDADGDGFVRFEEFKNWWLDYK